LIIYNNVESFEGLATGRLHDCDADQTGGAHAEKVRPVLAHQGELHLRQLSVCISKIHFLLVIDIIYFIYSFCSQLIAQKIKYNAILNILPQYIATSIKKATKEKK
jgi:hypothetical protein